MGTTPFSRMCCNEEKFVDDSEDTADFLFDFTQYQGSTISTAVSTGIADGRRSTPDRINRCITQPTLISATPGDLSFVLPYRHLKSIVEMLEALDRITPGISSRPFPPRLDSFQPNTRL
jgi:hypothetical protein